MKAAFGQPGFRLLFSGLFASMLGDSLMLIVLAVWVKELTGSNGAAGLTFFFLAIPALFAPLFGMVVDRFRRRTLLFWGNLASAVAVAPLLFVHDRGDVWIVYGVTVLYGISFIVLPAGLNGLLKEMMPDEMLIDANAALSTTKEALRLVGPLAGAGLFTLIGGGGVAVLDALSFVAAAVVIRVLKVREDRPVHQDAHFRDEVLAGIRHIRDDAALLHTMIAVGVSLLVIGFMESAVFAMVDAFGKPATYVGVVVSVQGVGAVAGGLSSSFLVKRVGETAAICGSLALFALGLAICAVSAWLPVIFVGVVVLGFGLPVFIISFNTLIQRRTPNRLMGRVSGAAEVVLGTPQACSIAVGALLVSVLSYRELYWICAAVILVSAVYLAWVLRAYMGPLAAIEPEESTSETPDPGSQETVLGAVAVTSPTVATPRSAVAGSAGDGALDQRCEDRTEVEVGGVDRQWHQ